MPSSNDQNSETLLTHLAQLHTTALGIQRIRKNLNLNTTDVVAWCRAKIQAPHSTIQLRGKNWYISVDNCIITVNAHSYTIITAHKEKQSNNMHDDKSDAKSQLLNEFIQ